MDVRIRSLGTVTSSAERRGTVTSSAERRGTVTSSAERRGTQRREVKRGQEEHDAWFGVSY